MTNNNSTTCRSCSASIAQAIEKNKEENWQRRERETERRKKKSVKQLNKAVLKEEIGREVTDEDENCGDNNNDAAAAVVFFREDREKNKQTRNRHMYEK